MLTSIACFNNMIAKYQEISDAQQAVKIKWYLQNLERIWNISSLAIENANPWCQLRTARLELYLPGNYISLGFPGKYSS